MSCNFIRLGVAKYSLFATLSNGERAAWDCPECGRKGNTGNFCGNCAHPAPSSEPEITTQPDGQDELSSFGYTTTTVNFREKASKNSARIRQLRKYAMCKVEDIVEVNGDTWYQVTYDGKTGYIMGNYFRQMTTAELDQFLYSPEYLQGITSNAATHVSTEKPSPSPKPMENRAIAVGDIIKFGHYEQDNNLNYSQEAIQWIVLDYDAAEKKVLLLSRYILDIKLYYEPYEETSWEKSSLRSWLNGEFLKTAFTAEEQESILKTNANNSRSQGHWNTDGGNNTSDRIFLLSDREAFEEYFKDDQSRTCKPTAYATAQGAYSAPGSGNGWWWLRSPGYNEKKATFVRNDGSRGYSDVDNKYGGIRPALWLNLDTGI